MSVVAAFRDSGGLNAGTPVAIASTRGSNEQQRRGGVDFGAMAEPPAEEALGSDPVVADAGTEESRQVDA